MSNPSRNYVYTDKCNDKMSFAISEKLGLEVIVRDDILWDLGYIAALLTNPYVSLLVINAVDERSIAEITMAAFMCKTILVTDRAITEYKHIYPMVDDLESGCNLELEKNTFIHWYTYTIIGR